MQHAVSGGYLLEECPCEILGIFAAHASDLICTSSSAREHMACKALQAMQPHATSGFAIAQTEHQQGTPVLSFQILGCKTSTLHVLDNDGKQAAATPGTTKLRRPHLLQAFSA